MKNIVGCVFMVLLLATVALAQPPAAAGGFGGQRGPGGPGGPGGAPAAGGGGVAVANPTYLVINLEVTVNKPAAEVWKRVGKYCDIGEWLRVPCTITSGKDGEVGTVRSIGSEILVGKTDLSYTYTQPARDGRPYDLYHGTLEAKPLTATTTKLVYTLMYDNSMLADDAARAANKTQKTTQFQGALDNMKILAEGGTMPAAPAGGGRGGPGGPGGGAGRGGPGAGGPPAGAPRGQ